jgi:hypothetical protein
MSFHELESFDQTSADREHQLPVQPTTSSSSSIVDHASPLPPDQPPAAPAQATASPAAFQLAPNGIPPLQVVGSQTTEHQNSPGSQTAVPQAQIVSGSYSHPPPSTTHPATHYRPSGPIHHPSVAQTAQLLTHLHSSSANPTMTLAIAATGPMTQATTPPPPPLTPGSVPMGMVAPDPVAGHQIQPTLASVVPNYAKPKHARAKALSGTGGKRKKYESDSDFDTEHGEGKPKRPHLSQDMITTDMPLNIPLTFEVTEQEKYFLLPFIRSEERRFQCKKCLFSFKGQSGAHQHFFRSGHSHAISGLECYFCSQVFEKPMDLLYHIAKIHTYQDQPFACKLCSSHFSSKSSLGQHVNQGCGTTKEESSKVLVFTSADEWMNTFFSMGDSQNALEKNARTNEIIKLSIVLFSLNVFGLIFFEIIYRENHWEQVI